MQTSELPDSLTLGQLRAAAAIISAGSAAAMKPAELVEGAALLSTRIEGDLRPVIVRARDAGVHYGKLVAYDGRTVWLRGARRLWSWRAKEGLALSGVAVNGIDASKSKIDTLVEAVTILDACEIIDATAKAAASIEAA